MVMVTRFNIVDGKPVMDTSGMFVLYSSYDILLDLCETTAEERNAWKKKYEEKNEK